MIWLFPNIHGLFSLFHGRSEHQLMGNFRWNLGGSLKLKKREQPIEKGWFMALVFSTLCCISMLVELAHHQKLSMVHLHVGLSKNPLVEGWQSSQRSENLQWRSSISYSLDLRVSRCQVLTLLHVLEFCLQPGETRICGGYAHIYIYTHTCIHIQYTYTVGWLYTLLEIVWLKAQWILQPSR